MNNPCSTIGYLQGLLRESEYYQLNESFFFPLSVAETGGWGGEDTV